MVPADSHRIPRVPCYSGYRSEIFSCLLRGFHPLWQTFPGLSDRKKFCYSVILLQQYLPVLQRRLCNGCNLTHKRFRLFPVRSPLLRECQCLFLFLRVLRCFTSPGSLPYTMDSCMDDRVLTCRVASFGNLRVKGYWHLLAAYRSLSRPSSPPDTKASTLRP